jgi:SnoaL-like domain
MSIHNKGRVTVTSDLEKLPNEWARAWSSSNDSERLLALFTDDCIFEDVTFGVATRGKDELRGFVNRAFAAVPDLTSLACPRLASAFRRSVVTQTVGLPAARDSSDQQTCGGSARGGHEIRERESRLQRVARQLRLTSEGDWHIDRTTIRLKSEILDEHRTYWTITSRRADCLLGGGPYRTYGQHGLLN